MLIYLNQIFEEYIHNQLIQNSDWNKNLNESPLINFYVKLLMLNSNFQQQAKKVLEKWGYQQIRKIGKGGFGHVVLVSKFFISMNFYAVKCFSLKNNNKEANLKRYIQQEVKIMDNINHPNVVRFQTSFQDSGWYFIVMEYCDMGNLLIYQSKLSNKTLGLAKASKILQQILNGISTIHSQNIIHRDIKCQNIFLKKNSKGNGYRCKIGDFGFAKQIDQYTRTSCGTTLFMAPEVLKKLPYSYQADIWSIGVVFYFMIFGDYPFKSINIEKQIYDKCNNGFSLSQALPAYKQKKEFGLLEDFFKRVFDLNQDRRIKLEEMIQHKIFKSGDGVVTQDQSDQVLDENLQWTLGKIKFIQDLISDLSNLKILDSYLLHSTRFYLYKVIASTLKEEVFKLYPHISSTKIGKEIQQKQSNIYVNIQKQYQSLLKFGNQLKKISNFSQGFNLQIQDFYAMKEGYRNTLALVYSDISKRIGNQTLKCQLRLRILCCHLINRVFGKSLKGDIFPNFNSWVKNTLNGTQLKKQRQFTRLNEWMQLESPDKLANQIDNINKKFYC